VGSPLPLTRYDPVTTDPERERPRTLSHPSFTIRWWQIYGRGNTRALDASAPQICRRISRDTSTVRAASRFRSRPGRHYESGWEVRPSLSVSQNGDRGGVLLEIQAYFGCGTLRPDRSDRTLKWEVRSLPLLVERVVPHFRRYPLRSGKQRDFEAFAEICEAMTRGEHLARSGLREIVRRAVLMNPSGKRGYMAEEILGALSR
jgi:hypothetical protein